MKHQTQEKPLKSQHQQPSGCYNLGRGCVRSARWFRVLESTSDVTMLPELRLLFSVHWDFIHLCFYLDRSGRRCLLSHQLKQALVKANRVISDGFSSCLRPDLVSWNIRWLWTLGGRWTARTHKGLVIHLQSQTQRFCVEGERRKKDNCCESDMGMTAVDLVFKAEEAD